jgi:hypothetical protein
MLFGVAGAALATWWWRRRDSVASKMSEAGQGEVIYRNNPVV